MRMLSKKALLLLLSGSCECLAVLSSTQGGRPGFPRQNSGRSSYKGTKKKRGKRTAHEANLNATDGNKRQKVKKEKELTPVGSPPKSNSLALQPVGNQGADALATIPTVAEKRDKDGLTAKEKADIEKQVENILKSMPGHTFEQRQNLRKGLIDTYLSGRETGCKNTEKKFAKEHDATMARLRQFQDMARKGDVFVGGLLLMFGLHFPLTLTQAKQTSGVVSNWLLGLGSKKKTKAIDGGEKELSEEEQLSMYAKFCNTMYNGGAGIVDWFAPMAEAVSDPQTRAQKALRTWAGFSVVEKHRTRVEWFPKFVLGNTIGRCSSTFAVHWLPNMLRFWTAGWALVLQWYLSLFDVTIFGGQKVSKCLIGLITRSSNPADYKKTMFIGTAFFALFGLYYQLLEPNPIELVKAILYLLWEGAELMAKFGMGASGKVMKITMHVYDMLFGTDESIGSTVLDTITPDMLGIGNFFAEHTPSYDDLSALTDVDFTPLLVPIWGGKPMNGLMKLLTSPIRMAESGLSFILFGASWKWLFTYEVDAGTLKKYEDACKKAAEEEATRETLGMRNIGRQQMLKDKSRRKGSK